MSAINGFSSGVSSGQGFSGMSSNDFMKIIFTELSRQDPTQPSDSKALLDQIATLRSIQSDTDLSDRLTSMTVSNEFAAASALMGRTIKGLSIDNQRVSGLVTSVSRTEYGPILNLKDGKKVLFSQVDEITDPTTTK